MTRDTPEWVDHMKGDTIPRDDYWRTSNSIPRRYHGGEQGGGYHHGYSHRSHHYDYTDNGAGDTSGKETPSDSLKSMKSKSKGGAAGAGAGGTCCGVAAKTCCIIWLLILGALLLAIGLGLLTYYLLVNSPGFRAYHTGKSGTSVADSTVRLMNTSYTEGMANRSSAEFRAIAHPFCAELDRYFKGDVYFKGIYESCVVSKLSRDLQPIVCECAGVLKTIEGGSVRVHYNLTFKGEISDEMRKRISGFIDSQTGKKIGKNYEVLFLKDFVVDIRRRYGIDIDSSTPSITPTTPRTDPGVGVITNLTIWVYNLSYSSILEDTNSRQFMDLADPFCADIEKIFRNSRLADRYFSCEVHSFG